MQNNDKNWTESIVWSIMNLILFVLASFLHGIVSWISIGIMAVYIVYEIIFYLRKKQYFLCFSFVLMANIALFIIVYQKTLH